MMTGYKNGQHFCTKDKDCRIVVDYYINRTLPDDCPLEEDVLHKMMKEKIFVLWKMVSKT